VLKEWLHDSDVPEFFYSKACVVLVFCFCVALPLSLFPNIHDLSFSSLLAVASVFVVAGTNHVLLLGLMCALVNTTYPLRDGLCCCSHHHDQGW
jgi:hypothetical protein